MSNVNKLVAQELKGITGKNWVCIGTDDKQRFISEAISREEANEIIDCFRELVTSCRIKQSLPSPMDRLLTVSISKSDAESLTARAKDLRNHYQSKPTSPSRG